MFFDALLISALAGLMSGAENGRANSHSPPGRAGYTTLTWVNYSAFWGPQDPEEAGYILNGKAVGKGTTGFNRMLRSLHDIRSTGVHKVFVFPDMYAPKPSNVPPEAWINYGGFMAEPPTPEVYREFGETVPFRTKAALIRKLMRVAAKRNLKVIYLPRDPTWYEKWCPQALAGRAAGKTNENETAAGGTGVSPVRPREHGQDAQKKRP